MLAATITTLQCATTRDARAQQAVNPRDAKRAKELFKQSEDAYRGGRLDEAVRLLNEAYALDPKPVLQYNLARAYEAQGDVPRAIDAYKSYLDHDPRAPDRGALEQRVATLERQQREKEELEKKRASASQVPAPTATPSATPAATAKSDAAPARGPSPVPWIAAGLGAASIGAGVALGAAARGKHDQATSEPSALAATDLQSSAERLALGANIALVAGGAIAAAGIVIGIVDLTRGAPAKKSGLRVDVGPSGATIRGAF